MLVSILRKLLTERRASLANLLLVCATRLDEQSFYSQSLLGRWLNNHPRYRRRIFFSNQQGLPGLFNAVIDQAQPQDILVFVHDDVWIEQSDFAAQLVTALRRFDLVGIAGNRRRVPGQTAWPFIPTPDNEFTWDFPNLSGAVLCESLRAPKLLDYGAAPAPCELLDGVLLAARSRVLQRGNVRFDEQFAFHFYDMDLCRQARANGLRLGTWPLRIFHASSGLFGSPSWHSGKERYLAKWKD
ncbi:glycosyltransferase family 2 protein [Pseudacidovorax sp. RU35E]|jgi:GT2 family glycosyltransferase|uniref:glycosyltransferase family 2 protein n=1 Tax=Pseudacidovorax sp. RU35E TaxID=1907403 RepID=UPI0009570953|nr:glycosyltransferase family 2 protein [Pseudacidovorax sp. RU35E]SIQ69004.1 Glycosyltransferase like family protein [Pseudacidovorax sp. RU35E]